MKDFNKYTILLDCYRNLLTEKELEVFISYYEQDLSISEIADNLNISRSAIHKKIKIVEDKLDNYEKILKLASKNQRLLELVSNLKEEKIKKEIIEIIDL